MLRAVLDSNVYISALLFGGKPRILLEVADLGLYKVLISEAIESEVVRVLYEKFNWPRSRAKEAIAYVLSRAERLIPDITVEDCRDPDDNEVLACALYGHADAIVSGDRDLLSLHPYRGIRVLTPNDFLDWAQKLI